MEQLVTRHVFATYWTSFGQDPNLLSHRIEFKGAIELPRKMKSFRLKAFCLLPIFVGLAEAQLGLKDGFVSFNTSAFSIQLVKDSQTLFSLKPSGSTFDFIPGDQMSAREAN